MSAKKIKMQMLVSTSCTKTNFQKLFAPEMKTIDSYILSVIEFKNVS